MIGADTRGASPVIGSILLVAVIVVLASIVSVFMLGMIDDFSRHSPLTKFSTESDSNGYTVTHVGGDEIDSNNIYVLVGNQQKKWSDYTGTDSVVQPGDSITLTQSISGDEANLMLVYAETGYSSVLHRSTLYNNDDANNPSSVLNSPKTVVYSGLNALPGDNGNPTTIEASGVEALGASGYDISNDGTNDLPYIENGDLRIIDESGNTQTLVDDDASSNPDTDKTLMAVGSWQGSGTSVFYVNENHNTIYRVDSSGTTSVVANPSNGANGVLGFGDVDNDDDEELIFADGSQQTRYIEPNGDIQKIQNGGVGSNNGIGVGEVADFDGDGTDRIATVDGSNNIRLVGVSESDITFTSTDAAKSPVTVADVDDDGNPEVVYLSTGGNLRYVDDVLTSPNTNDLTSSNGNTVTGDDSIGVVSG